MLLQGLFGNRGVLTVNHLVTTVKSSPKDSSMITSEYITREVLKKTEVKFLRQLTLFSQSQPSKSFDGWVFQMDVLKKVELAFSTNSPLTFTNKTEAWRVRKYNEYEKPEELQPSPQENDSWFIPTKQNQGCFNALQLLVTKPLFRNAVRTLRVVQITVAKTHSLKLCFVLPVLEALKPIHKLDVVVLIPPENTNEFEIDWNKSDVAYNHQEIKALNWKREDVRVLGYKRASQS